MSLAVLLCAMPGRAWAQSSVTLPEKADIETDLSSAPRAGQSGVSATIGGEIDNGRTQTIALNLTGLAAHTTAKHQLLRFDFSDTYAKYRPGTTGPRYLAEDNQLAQFTYLQTVKTNYGLLGRVGWRRDAILGLDYRAWVEGGAGREIYANSRVNSFIGASYAVGREHRPFTSQGADVLDAGLLQTFNLVITPVLGFHEWFAGHVQTNDTSDHSYSFNATLLAKVAKHAGLKIAYALQDDSLHLPTVGEWQSTMTIGMQISFQPPAPPATPPAQK